MGYSMQAVLSNPLFDSQIHARNLKGPAKRDLLYHKPVRKVLSARSHEIPTWI